MRSLLFSLLMIAIMGLGCKDDPDEPQNTGICGTWLEVVVDFEAVVWNHQLDEPVEGAELSCCNWVEGAEGAELNCDGEVRATSNEDGVIAFTLETLESVAGCGYKDCNYVGIEAPSDALQPVTMELDEANGSTIELTYGGD